MSRCNLGGAYGRSIVYKRLCPGRGAVKNALACQDIFKGIPKKHPESRVTSEFNAVELNCMVNRVFQEREELILRKELEDKTFDLAWQFAKADKIVIAAPFWEFSFPAVLKVYIENVSVAGISFEYVDNGSRGLCKADKLLFVTTRGGYYSEGFAATLEMGSRYLEALCVLFGISKYQCIYAEGLDIIGNDVEKILNDAGEEAKALAAEF